MTATRAGAVTDAPSSPPHSPSPRSGPTPPAPFQKPSPGCWQLDASHFERPLPRIMSGIFEDAFTAGNRHGAAAYGLLFDTAEAALVNGFMYVCPRGLGGPPEPKGSPPKLLMKVMVALHPGLRKRVRDGDRALAAKRWREDTRRYLEEVPPIEARAEELLEQDLAALDDAALAEHVERARQLVLDDLRLHYRYNIARVVPVGDLIAQVRGWDDVPVADILAALRGFSPSSEEGLDELEALAELVREDETLAHRIRDAASDAIALLGELEGRTDAVGEAARAWLGVVGHRVTAFSPGYPTLRETPGALVASLRAALDSPRREDALAEGHAAGHRLRERIPEPHREAFDSLLEEARSVYFLRDHMTMRNTATFGVLRLALLEAGRRLEARGWLDDAEAALDLTLEELRGVLVDGREGEASEARKWYAWRRAATSDDAPETLGPPPLPFPSLDLFPPGQARLLGALVAYDEAMNGEVEPPSERSVVVRGLGASPGKRQGTARLVLEPGDFDRVRSGDVLVARMTTPTYNVLLPLLAGVVTDRGGILSHPAIVSREYGIPGVVGTRVATGSIPDGARVEIDGAAGTVRILS